MPRVVIADATTLIGLENISSLHLLQQPYGEIEITSIVKEEYKFVLPIWVKVNDTYNQQTMMALAIQLDPGEASAIAALALKHKTALLIIDERRGRRKANELGLTITGLAGIIIKAKKADLIKSGKEKLDALLSQGFRLSSRIYALALEAMNEN